MGATLALCILTVGLLAALGRSVTPVDQPRPWWFWTWQDWTTSTAHGARRLAALNHRQRHLWDRYLDQLQPWRNRSDRLSGTDGHEKRVTDRH